MTDGYKRTLDRLFELANVTELSDLETVVLAGRLHRERTEQQLCRCGQPNAETQQKTATGT